MFDLFEMGAVVVLTILIAYILGLMISNIVDKKLGNISIKLPQFQVSPHQVLQNQISQNESHNQFYEFKVTEKSDGNLELSSDLIEQTPIKQKSLDHPNKIAKYEPFLAIDFDNLKGNKTNSGKTQNPKTQSVKPQINVETTIKRTIGCTTDDDCNGTFGDGKNVCKSDGTCHCISGSGPFCQWGPTNYKDPKDMTPEERQRFKWKYRNNMTVQDYKNWLLLYKDEIENLRQHHRRNLLKILKGGRLSERDVPAIQLKPPTTAADYFQKMYKGGKISVHFPDNDSPLIGSNYNQFNDFISPEDTASSWITGVVDLYKETKDDAKALDWHLRPEPSTKYTEQTIGDIYQKYVKNEHDYSDMRKIAQMADPKDFQSRKNKTLDDLEDQK